MPLVHEISPELAAAITAANIRYNQVDDYSLAQITDRLQVRHDLEHLNTGKVAEYRNKFRAGSLCPPIGVTRDGWLIWGNHRVAGALAAEWQSVPALVFDIDAAGLDSYNTAVLMTLSGRENAGHGIPLSTKDRELVVRMELEMQTPTNAIAQAYGMTASQVSGLRREMDAEERLDKLGLKLAGPKSRGVIRALSGPNARTLTDAPFKDLVSLVNDADLSASEINTISKEARETASETGAVSIIKGHRTTLNQRIADVATTGMAVRPSPSTNLRKAITTVLNLCESHQPEVYRDHSSDVAVTVAALDDAIKCLTNIRKAQA